MTTQASASPPAVCGGTHAGRRESLTISLVVPKCIHPENARFHSNHFSFSISISSYLDYLKVWRRAIERLDLQDDSYQHSAICRQRDLVKCKSRRTTGCNETCSAWLNVDGVTENVNEIVHLKICGGFCTRAKYVVMLQYQNQQSVYRLIIIKK